MTNHYNQAFNFDLFEPFICYKKCADLTSVQQHWNGHCFVLILFYVCQPIVLIAIMKELNTLKHKYFIVHN
jgi:hypothetical protein